MQAKHFRATGKASEDAGKVIRGSCTDVTEVLGNNQFRRQFFQDLRLNCVGAFALRDKFANQAIDLRWARSFWNARADDGSFRFRAGRIVAFMADANNFVVEAEIKEDFGGRGDQRDDTHNGTLSQKVWAKEPGGTSPQSWDHS